MWWWRWVAGGGWTDSMRRLWTGGFWCYWRIEQTGGYWRRSVAVGAWCVARGEAGSLSMTETIASSPFQSQIEDRAAGKGRRYVVWSLLQSVRTGTYNPHRHFNTRPASQIPFSICPNFSLRLLKRRKYPFLYFFTTVLINVAFIFLITVPLVLAIYSLKCLKEVSGWSMHNLTK